MIYIKLLKLRMDIVSGILTTGFEDIITTIDICPQINRLDAKIESCKGNKGTTLAKDTTTTTRKVVGVPGTTTMTLLEALEIVVAQALTFIATVVA